MTIGIFGAVTAFIIGITSGDLLTLLGAGIGAVCSILVGTIMEH